MVTKLLCNSIAPAVVRALPIREAPSDKVMAPFAMTVPWKAAPAPKKKAPLICQYTLHREAPLASVIVAPAAALKAPFILIKNRALGSPPASRVKFPGIAAAPTVV